LAWDLAEKVGKAVVNFLVQTAFTSRVESPVQKSPHRRVSFMKQLADARPEELPSLLDANAILIDSSLIESMEELIKDLHRQAGAASPKAVLLRSLVEQFRLYLGMPAVDTSGRYAELLEKLHHASNEELAEVLREFSDQLEDPVFISRLRADSNKLAAHGNVDLSGRLRAVADRLESILLLTRMIEIAGAFGGSAREKIFGTLDKSVRGISDVTPEVFQEVVDNIFFSATPEPVKLRVALALAELAIILVDYARGYDCECR
jgi:hypothetical protein